MKDGDESMVSESEGEIEYCDPDFLNEMDNDDGPGGGDGDSDFKTVNESDFGESEMMYDEGQIIDSDIVKHNDSVASTK